MSLYPSPKFYVLIAFHLLLSGSQDALTNYGSALVPFVLIGLGIFIAWDSGTLETPSLGMLTLAVSCLCLIGLFIINGREPEVSQN